MRNDDRLARISPLGLNLMNPGPSHHESKGGGESGPRPVGRFITSEEKGMVHDVSWVARDWAWACGEYCTRNDEKGVMDLERIRFAGLAVEEGLKGGDGVCEWMGNESECRPDQEKVLRQTEPE
jgi:hypothetical protein